MLASPDQQISLTDPDSRSMATSGRGSGVVGYNVQVAVDTESHLIITHEVTNVGSDPVAQQEEEQIQHDEKSDDDLECGLADIDGLGGEELASSQENVGQSLLHRGKVGQPEAIEQTRHPCRQGVQDLLKIVGEIQFSGAEPLVQA